MKRVHWLVFLLVGGLAVVSSGAEYYTEVFGTFDLTGLSLTFTPDGSSDYYAAEAVPITALPVPHAGHAVTSLGDDDSNQFTFADGKTFTFYGTPYTGVDVGSNGYLTFLHHDTTYSVSISNHFNTARISTYYNDLDPGDGLGEVKVAQLADRFVVTFVDVPEFPGGTSDQFCTFQTELFFDGHIRMSWLRVDDPTDYTIVGLSRGLGVPADGSNSDLSMYARDIDEDRITEEWERFYFGHPSNCTASADFDSDGFDNLSEYICGTDPKDETSLFSLHAVPVASGAAVSWNSVEGRRYRILKSANLILAPFTEVGHVDYPRSSYTNTTGSAGFYRVEVELAP